MLESDIVAVTKTISADDLIKSYVAGIFPWPFSEEDDFIPWCSPSMRGVLEFKDLHLSRSTIKNFKQNNFSVSFNQDFENVMHLCASIPRKGQDGTWITSDLTKAYNDLFKMKKAYSVEVYKDKKLVGGMYGVISHCYLSGESMFHTETGASKFALFSLIKKLESLGLSWLDTQMVTPLLSSFGGKEIQKTDFLNRISRGKILGEDFFERLKSDG